MPLMFFSYWIVILCGLRHSHGLVVSGKTRKIATFPTNRIACSTNINLRPNANIDHDSIIARSNEENVSVSRDKNIHSKKHAKSKGKSVVINKSQDTNSTNYINQKQPVLEDIGINEDYESSSGTFLTGNMNGNAKLMENTLPNSLLWKALILCFLPFGFSVGGYQLAKYCTEHIVVQFSSPKQDPSFDIYPIEERLFVALKNLVVVAAGITSGFSAILGIIGLFSLVYAISTEAGRK